MDSTCYICDKIANEGSCCCVCGFWHCDSCIDYKTMRELHESSGKECTAPLCKDCASTEEGRDEYLDLNGVIK